MRRLVEGPSRKALNLFKRNPEGDASFFHVTRFLELLLPSWNHERSQQENRYSEADILGRAWGQDTIEKPSIASPWSCPNLDLLVTSCYLDHISSQFLCLTAQVFLIQVLPQKRKIQVKEKDVLIIFSFFWFYQVIRHWGKDSNKIFKDRLKNFLPMDVCEIWFWQFSPWLQSVMKWLLASLLWLCDALPSDVGTAWGQLQKLGQISKHRKYTNKHGVPWGWFLRARRHSWFSDPVLWPLRCLTWLGWSWLFLNSGS